jgi:hypothetical protein
MRASFFAQLTVGLVLAGLSNVAMAQSLDDMISPVTAPTIFEDARHSTELRPIYAYHSIDDDFVTEGGNVQIYALQARFKLTDDLSFLATKDGFVDFNPNAVLNKDTGFANVAAGFKYSTFKTDTSIVSAGLRYEIPMGNRDVLQGSGDGDINPFVSAATVLGSWNLMANTGFRIAFDDQYSSFYDLNLHVSYKLGDFYPLAEVNHTTVVADGTRLAIADEGQDFFNLGASKAGGNSLTAFGLGARYRLTDSWDIGAAWQFPLYDGPGTRVVDYRVTADMIFRFNFC